MLYRTRDRRQERRRRFEELRAQHLPPRSRRFAWTHAVGLGLLAVAALAAFDPDYPIPTDIPRPASAQSRVYLLPEGADLDPVRGPTGWEFTWSWHGPEVVWSLVVLDGQFAPLARVDGVRGLSFRPDAALTELLEQPGTGYWFVESELEGVRFRSTPKPLPIRR